MIKLNNDNKKLLHEKNYMPAFGFLKYATHAPSGTAHQQKIKKGH